MKRLAVVIGLSLSMTLSICCLAQKNEVSLTLGGITSSDQTNRGPQTALCAPGFPNCGQFSSSTNTGFAIDGTVARQLRGFRAGSLDLELPFMVVPGRDVSVISPFLSSVAATGSISTFFFTPSVRLKFLPSAPISPFVTIGGGLAHFGTSASVAGISASTNHAALQFGGGLDFRTRIPHLGLRAEVRDFRAASPFTTSSIVISPDPQNNVFFGGGIVLKF